MDYRTDKKIKLGKTKTVTQSRNTGFVSLIALLLANIFLLIGMSVFAISIKELGLSFGGRESLFAFYAADGGMECALYWDIQNDAFATSSPPRLDPQEIICNNKTIPFTYTDLGEGKGESTFEYSFDTTGGDVTEPCVTVIVGKKFHPTTGDPITEIISRGRNNCDINDPRRVERAWRVTYR